MKRKVIFFGIALVLGLAIGMGIAQSQNIKQVQTPTLLPDSTGSKFEDAVINVAGSVGKAVVSISTEHTAKIPGGRSYYFSSPFGQSPLGGNDALRKFFDDFFGEIPEREYKQIGLGSGVIIDSQGFILTNEHVINDADKISVTLPDGRNFKAEVKGKDPRSDLAIVKINATNLPLARLGDSGNLKIGQWVVAIGNPFGFALQNPEPTVTAGVISALHRTLGRTLSAERDYNDLIQTDAAINPGNSGGPLVNLKGEIVGINVAIFSTTGGYQGVGFAIPVNNAKRILNQLIAGKKITYGWLGVTVQDLTDDLAKYFGLPDNNGVLVAKVLENSPAQKAGLEERDIIKQVGTQPINRVKELLNIVAEAPVGSKLQMKVIRDKKEIALEVTIGERPENPEENPTEGVVSGGWRGLKVEDLTPELVQRFSIQERQGVVITEIAPNSPADAVNLNPGEVILEINKQPVNNTADFEKVTKDLKGDALVRTSRGYFVIKE